MQREEMTSPSEIHSIQLPREYVIRSGGFSMDFGGSVIKIVYRTKEDYDAAMTSEKPISPAHLVAFPSSGFEEAIKFLQTNCYISKPKDGGPTLIHGTGVGCHKNADILQKELNVTLEVVPEMDCFVKTFQEICATFPKGDIVYAKDPDAVKEANDITQKLMDYLHGCVDESPGAFPGIQGDGATRATEADTRCGQPYSKSENIFPCLLVMCGSGLGFIVIKADGTTEYTDESSRGGRMLLGLGNILTRAKTFDDLIALAERGNNLKLDVTGKELRGEGGSDNPMYSTIPDVYVGYSFGQASGLSDKQLEDIKKEDIARSLLVTTLKDMVMTSHLEALVSKAKHVFFAGSLVGNQLVRNIITVECATRKFYKGEDNMVDFQFLKHGGHIGAMGAFGWS